MDDMEKETEIELKHLNELVTEVKKLIYFLFMMQVSSIVGMLSYLISI